MPARDTYHDQFRQAFVKDGWTITDDPLRLVYGVKDRYVDLGAERFLGAERGQVRIAVEIKSFVGKSDVEDLEKALGQYVLYQDVLSQIDPDRFLYLAVRRVTFAEVFDEPLGRLMLDNQRFQVVVFDEVKEEVVRWIPTIPTGS